MNKNVLVGIACPKCGSQAPFRIVATANFLVFDDGTEEYSDVEWEDNSAIQCFDCLRRGKVSEFRKENAKKEKP